MLALAPTTVTLPMATELKNKGNQALAAGKIAIAFEYYTQAIELDDSNAIYYANRAQAAIKLEEFGTAIEDCTKAIERDPDYTKAYYRRAIAYCGCIDYKSAIPDYQVVLAKAPTDAAAHQKLETCRKFLRAQAFQKAIEVEDEPSIFEQLNIEHMIDDDGLPKISSPEFLSALIERFKAGEQVSRKKCYQLIKGANDLFEAEPTMNELKLMQGKVTVCGDTHGQFYDFLNIFEMEGWPSDTHTYLFNGDFVDRGSWSTEIALVLYAMKIAMPKNVYINRGNHETDGMNLTYGFSGECKAKYKSDMVFKAFSESFAKLPLAALIGDSYLVLHGGLFSRDGVTLDDIRKLDRFATPQPGQQGLMMEMLWADPQPQDGRSPSKRGIGHQFGPDVTRRFCEQNKLKGVIRSHEVRDDGYSVEHDGRLITVFSAPNYCDSQGNKAAVINIGTDLELNYVQYSAVEHPSIPPMAYASNLMR